MTTAAPVERPDGIGWALPVGVVVAATAVGATMVGGRVQTLFQPLAELVLIVLLALTMRGIATLPDLPRATASFWRIMSRAMYVYTAGMLAELVSDWAQLFFGVLGQSIGRQYFFPVAGAVTIVAMFRYPTTAVTWAQRVTVALDVANVLLGSTCFLWFFLIGPSWEPSDGLTDLAPAIVAPLVTLMSGFALAKVAIAGAGIMAGRTLAWFAACVGLAAIGSAFQADQGSSADRVNGVLLAGALLCGLVGVTHQYRRDRTVRARLDVGRRRRPFSVLPFGVSIAALALVMAVIAPGLEWRRAGVLAVFALLVCTVTIRQVVALRDNATLLSRNHELTIQLQRQAWYDGLTGLANRVLFGERVAQAVDRFRVDGRPVAVALIDLDDFKQVNDTLGHAAGDELLREVAARLTRATRNDDLVCRLGGDEFVLIAHDLTRAAAADLASRLVDTLAEPVLLAAGAVNIGGSVGIAFTTADTADTDELLHHADLAMYAAKSAGKAQWSIFDPDETPNSRSTPTRLRAGQ
ncbi:GGDEF domain-containing protein [Virgisporangium aurantiacum]|uniref:GGDEF domain-containing protein n=1 Tax=Virgisporangium aurantiacum TaxID=175570 RepID=A0A8J4E733_9ACTN|nr:GGDEF domain-containing protein [Virgisporangium aurantiacum]GIJ63748.1 hypothetical protein Vau01_112640 [Virgisporangium aurantiacum]